MIDLHTHTIFSDGELLPTELIRRAMVNGYEGIAITDHADYTNLESLIERAKKARYVEKDYKMKVVAGVEITHVPPLLISKMAAKAKKLGAEIVIVHGETPAEPVMPGTNMAAVKSKDVDILAHPGFLTEEEAALAVKNNVYIEVTARKGHNMTNGHVARIASAAGAGMVVNTDTHSPDDLITKERALKVAMGAGLLKGQAETTARNSKALLKGIMDRRA